MSARPVLSAHVNSWRELYRVEMDCQIVHDSIHSRRGWTQEYALTVDDRDVGYGSVAIAGPWTGKPTAYEFFVVSDDRVRLFDLFEAFLGTARPVAIELQSNDMLAIAMLHTFAKSVCSEAILFEDHVATRHKPDRGIFRTPRPGELADVRDDQLKWRGVIEVDGQIVANGGILFHYNPPYGDIFMEVAEPFRRRGLGVFLVQELKRLCYEGGFKPGARCNPKNIASRRTLQKAGLVPCGHILVGAIHDAGTLPRT